MRLIRLLLLFLAAQGLDELFTALMQDIPDHIQVDLAIIVSEPSVSLSYTQRVTRVSCGMINQLLGQDGGVFGLCRILIHPFIMKRHPDLSDALVRLKVRIIPRHC